jgi:hypothetical protein
MSMNRRDIISSLMAIPAVAAMKAAPDVVCREPVGETPKADEPKTHPLIIFKLPRDVPSTGVDRFVDSLREWAAGVDWPRQHILVLPGGVDVTVVPGGPAPTQEEIREDWKRVLEERDRKRREDRERLIEEFTKK